MRRVERRPKAATTRGRWGGAPRRVERRPKAATTRGRWGGAPRRVERRPKAATTRGRWGGAPRWVLVALALLLTCTSFEKVVRAADEADAPDLSRLMLDAGRPAPE